MNNIFTPFLTKKGKLNSNLIGVALQDKNIQNLFKTYSWCKSIKELFYCYNNNIHSHPKCESCQNLLTYRNPKDGYGIACSKECISKCNSIKNKKSKTKTENLNKEFEKLKKQYPWIKTNQEGNYCKSNNICSQPICPNCGDFCNYILGHGYPQRCSIKCSNQQDAKERFEKTKITNLERYGAESYTTSQDWKNKQKDITEKIKNTCMERYNATSWAASHINEKSLKLLNDKEFLIKEHHTNKKPLYAIAEELRVSASYVGLMFKKHNIKIDNMKKTSHLEKRIVNYIKSISPEAKIETNVFGILSHKREIDILVNGILAIELDSLYWHSYRKKETNIQKIKHQQKTLECRTLGIDMFQIWDYEWKNPTLRKIWKSKIKQKLNIFENSYMARKLHVKQVSKNEATDFLKQNHIQQKCGAVVTLGLYDQDKLVSLMSFGKPRFNKKFEWELIRFVSKTNTKVVGGATKLLSHFEKTYKPKNIISYANLRFSHGQIYKVLGFQEIGISNPNYKYTDSQGINIYNRVKCQKHKLHKFLPNFQPEMTEVENMFAHGYRRFWDSGNLVFIKEYS